MTGPVDDAADLLEALRARRPLVHYVTSPVVMNFTANALLAAGASPVMARAEEEMDEVVARADALVVNLGTLDPPVLQAIRRATRAAAARRLPWTLDPVGAGFTGFRAEAARSLLPNGPAAIRGNASEIRALARPGTSAGKGVDSTDSVAEAEDAARALTRIQRCVVAITGEVDLVTDGQRAIRIANGDPMMARVTGMGCAASALVGAALALGGDRMTAVAAAIVWLGVAGEIAATRSDGPGSFQFHLLDALHGLDGTTLRARARIS
jgi:hydroxyethylthiazole kinase